MREDREARYGHLEAQLEAAVNSEISKLSGASKQLLDVDWTVVDARRGDPLRRLAIVAADAGNVRLRMNPMRIAFIRVASSDDEQPLGEVVFPAGLEPERLVEKLEQAMPDLVGPLRRAGVDVERLIASAGLRRDSLAAIREVLEWGAVLRTVQQPSDGPLLVVRDGLLRSIHFDTDSFARLSDGLRSACAAQGHLLVAVAKSMPGGADLANALLLGGVLDRRPDAPLALLKIPERLERDLLPGSFVAGRRMGPLLLARVQRTGSFVPLEVADSSPAALEAAAGSLFGAEAEYYPEPGAPIEVLIAHKRARISALDREWLHRVFLDSLRQRDPQLARRALAADVLGKGGPIVTEEAFG